MKVYIYKITNNKNGKVYIGKTVNFDLLFNHSRGWTSRINAGAMHYDENLEYPLRKT